MASKYDQHIESLEHYLNTHSGFPVINRTIKTAIKFAREYYDGLCQEDDTDKPYLCFALTVAVVMSDKFKWNNTDSLVVAILHNILGPCDEEERGKRMQRVAKTFGEGVANAIMDVTCSTPSAPRHEYAMHILNAAKTLRRVTAYVLLVKEYVLLSTLAETVHDDYMRDDIHAYACFVCVLAMELQPRIQNKIRDNEQDDLCFIHPLFEKLFKKKLRMLDINQNECVSTLFPRNYSPRHGMQRYLENQKKLFLIKTHSSDERRVVLNKFIEKTSAMPLYDLA